MEQTQEAPVVETQVIDNGTSETQGQPETVVTDTSAGQPNDPSAFQADYTRKYQELGEQRRAIEAENARLLAEKQAFEAQRQQYQQQVYQQPQFQPQQQVNPLLEQLGTEAGSAVLGEINNIKLQFALQQEEQLAKQKFGAEYDKYNYQKFNPQTGQIEVRNKIMDARLSGNVHTGEFFTLDQAYNSLQDPKTMKEQLRAEIMAELQAKERGTPAIQQASAPSQPANNVKNIDDAFALAMRQNAR